MTDNISINERKVSVIIPTHNRHEALAETLEHLSKQSLSRKDYEVIVVDDGSLPRVSVPPSVRLVRLEGEERSAARNAGARAARGQLLVFIDDDITVGPDFLETHLKAHDDWPNALLVGAIRLPEEFSKTPFGRFRQQLEDNGLPVERGLTSMPNLCTAANMAVPVERFEEIGGFDPAIASSEDQDFALRHTSLDGQIAFVPEAKVIHRDNALDVRTYCERVEWGTRMMIPFCRRYPDFPDNVKRRQVNSRFNTLKSFLSTRLGREFLFWITRVAESSVPSRFLLDRLYRALLGTHIYSGYRDGDRRA